MDKDKARLTPEEWDRIYSDWLTQPETAGDLANRMIDAQLAKIYKPQVCPKCKGEKVVENWHKIGMDTMYSTDEPCPTCKGTGKKQ
ncbi:hypothetical protein LCGC14_2212540 [marine sediment metagenome]|uniref:Uncharacterized protein n=1 Tax=marine sediment metagenome TaxID=412755 RepID=A0A0F9DDG4_9ZZZZ